MTKRNLSKKKKKQIPYLFHIAYCWVVVTLRFLCFWAQHTLTHTTLADKGKGKKNRTEPYAFSRSFTFSFSPNYREWVTGIEKSEMGSGAGTFLKVLLKNFDVLAGYAKTHFTKFAQPPKPFLFFWVSFLLSNLISGFVSCRPVVSLVYPLWVWFKDNNFMCLFSFALFCVRVKLIFGCFIGMPQLGQ